MLSFKETQDSSALPQSWGNLSANRQIALYM